MVYVAPRGARAASAGTFITMAWHVAAMAPGTNIGAAHPVSGEGKDIEGDMRQKVENDLVAVVQSIADKCGRNAEWAEKAMRDSASVTETDASQLKVIDLIAEDVADLLRQLDGRQVTLAGRTVTLQTAGVAVQQHQMSWRQQVLAVVSHPQIALMLLSLGSLGLLIELYNPGLIFPGVIGAIALLLAFYSLQTLPINYAFAFLPLPMKMFLPTSCRPVCPAPSAGSRTNVHDGRWREWKEFFPPAQRLCALVVSCRAWDTLCMDFLTQNCQCQRYKRTRSDLS